MKNLGKLKLKQLKKEELERREMNALKGGCSCGTACGCGSDGSWSGGSSYQNNYGQDTNLISSITVKIIGYR